MVDGIELTEKHNNNPFMDSENVNEERRISELSHYKDKPLSRLRTKQTIIFATIELLLILCYAFCTEYGAGVAATTVVPSNLSTYYPMFQDVHIMIFVGFGFLMTFVKFNSWSGVGFNFMIAALALQWGILCYGFAICCMNGTFVKLQLSLGSFVQGDFCAAAILISYGAIVGKVNALQLMVIVLSECFFYSMNAALCEYKLKAMDVGGAMNIHAFGAYFGLGLSFMIGPAKVVKSRKDGSNYNSNIFGFIGCLFLWVFWPSFVAITSVGASQHRAVLNCILSISCSCLGAFMQSQIRNKGLFKMADALNATLAGGVVVGTTCTMITSPWVAMLVGFTAGQISTEGFNSVTPWLNKKIHDTAGVNNLHGIPGVLSGIVGAIIVACAKKEDYGVSWGSVMGELGAGRRSNWNQFGWQLLAVFNSVAISFVSGALTGLLCKLSVFEPAKAINCFDDEWLWKMDHSEEPLDKKCEHITKHTVQEVTHLIEKKPVEVVEVHREPVVEVHREVNVRREPSHAHHHQHEHVHRVIQHEPVRVNREVVVESRSPVTHHHQETNYVRHEGSHQQHGVRQGRYSNSAQNRLYN